MSALRDFMRADFMWTQGEPTLFFDRADLRPGDVWPREVLAALREARVMVACLSPAYWQREWTRREWEEFQSRHPAHRSGDDTIVLVRLMETTPADGEPPLGDRHHVDLTAWFALDPAAALADPEVRDALERTCESIDARLLRAALDSGLGNLRRYNPRFIGRVSEIAELRGLLSTSRVGLVTAVGAMGGVGKTDLVAAYAHEFRYAYAGGAWRVGCEGLSSVTEALVVLSHELGIAVGDDVPPAQRSAVRARLTVERLHREEAHTLLVLDNVTEPGFLSDGSIAGLPEARWLHVVATTRLTGPEEGRDRTVQVLELGFLDLDACVELVRARQPFRGDDDLDRDFVDGDAEQEARVLVATLGGHALAVEQAAIYLGSNPELRPADVTSLLVDVGVTVIEQLDPSMTSMTYQAGTAADVSLGALLSRTTSQLSDRAREALDLAALMPPDGIRWSWLEELTESQDAGAQAPEHRWERVRRELTGRRLVVQGEGPDDARLHRLIGQFVRGSGGEAHAQSVSERLDSWVSDHISRKDLSRNDAARSPDATEDAAVAELIAAIDTMSMSTIWNIPGFLMFSTVPFAVQLKVGDRVDRVLAPQAEHDHEVALQLAWWRTQAVSLHADLGDLAAAQEMLVRTRDVLSFEPSAELEPTWRRRARLWLWLAGRVARQSMEWEEAEERFTRALELSRQFMAEEPDDPGHAYLAVEILEELGDLAWDDDRDRAVDLWQEALTLVDSAVDDDPLRVQELQAGLVDRLARHAMVTGDAVAAATHADLSAVLTQEVFSAQQHSVFARWDLSKALSLKAEVASLDGQLSRASEMLSASVGHRRVLLELDPHRWEYAEGLAGNLEELAALGQRMDGPGGLAREQMIEALSLRRSLATRHSDQLPFQLKLIRTLIASGRLMYALNRPAEASEQVDEATERCRVVVHRLATPESIRELMSVLDVAADLASARDQPDHAFDLYSELLWWAHGLREDGVGPAPRELALSANAASWLGSTCWMHGDLDGAARAYEELVAICRAGHQQESAVDPKVPLLSALDLLGQVQVARGRPELARPVVAEALSIAWTLTVEHPVDSDVRWNAAVTLGHASEAEPDQAVAAQLLRVCLGQLDKTAGRFVLLRAVEARAWVLGRLVELGAEPAPLAMDADGRTWP